MTYKREQQIVSAVIVLIMALCLGSIAYGYHHDRTVCRALYARAVTLADTLRVAAVGSCEVFYPLSIP